MSPEGLLLINKPVGVTSFGLVARLRKILGVKKIGHAGTLDPFATGVMVMLVGRNYTRLSERLLSADKSYTAQLTLGITTDSYDCDGKIIAESDLVPSLAQLEEVMTHFQGEIWQTPPMFSAKKVGGKKLYQLARAGKEIERKAVAVRVSSTVLRYEYPHVDISVTCSKGTYIRSIGHEIGRMLGCGAHLSKLERTRSGSFTIDQCFDGKWLYSSDIMKTEMAEHLLTLKQAGACPQIHNSLYSRLFSP